MDSTRILDAIKRERAKLSIPLNGFDGDARHVNVVPPFNLSIPLNGFNCPLRRGNSSP